METKICPRCQTNFIVTDEDIQLLTKISPEINSQKFPIPSPSLCPQCREQHRLAWRNERKLYKRKCHLCQKEMVSIYSPDKDYKVCCATCFWSDQWDPTDIGQDYDFNQPFFEQFNELLKKSKLITLFGTNNENSEFVNNETDDKNCYMCIGGHYNQDCYYNTYSLKGKNNIDNYWVWECELLYECLICTKCSNCTYLNCCASCHNCHYCYNCVNCQDCFGSINLKHKQYYFFNQPLTKEEYEKKVSDYLVDNPISKIKTDFEKLKKECPVLFADIQRSENCVGDVIAGSKNIAGYFVEDCEDCKNVMIVAFAKDNLDCTCAGWGDLNYEIMSTIRSSRNLVLVSTDGLNDSFYSFVCFNSQNLFGCVGFDHKQYYILNKQYSKEEYEKLVPQIIEHMQKTGEWGQFFPTNISPFGYNETVAMEYYPLTKDQATKINAKWQDEDFGTKYNGPFYEPKDISIYSPTNNPNAQTEIDNCLNGILKCEITNRPFKILPQELAQYIERNIQIPRRHPDQRHLDRLTKLNPRKLWHRQCMCEESNHNHSGRCPNEFETTYSPEKPEKIYCESCYQKSVL